MDAGLTDSTPEELTNDFMEMSALIPVPHEEEVREEVVSENKWSLDNLAECL